MSELAVNYTDIKWKALQKAVNQLKASKKEKQLIGPEDSNEEMWVTNKDSSLGRRIISKNDRYKQYPSYIDDGNEYIVFSVKKS